MLDPKMRWWHSDYKERWYGDYETRDEVLREGLATYGLDVGFYIMQAEQGNYHLSGIFDDVFDRIDEVNYDRTDPDGDQSVFSVTREQSRELITDLENTFGAWIARHGLSTITWAFARQSTPEYIEGATLEQD